MILTKSFNFVIFKFSSFDSYWQRLLLPLFEIQNRFKMSEEVPKKTGTPKSMFGPKC